MCSHPHVPAQSAPGPSGLWTQGLKGSRFRGVRGSSWATSRRSSSTNYLSTSSCLPEGYYKAFLRLLLSHSESLRRLIICTMCYSTFFTPFLHCGQVWFQNGYFKMFGVGFIHEPPVGRHLPFLIATSPPPLPHPRRSHIPESLPATLGPGPV